MMKIFMFTLGAVLITLSACVPAPLISNPVTVAPTIVLELVTTPTLMSETPAPAATMTPTAIPVVTTAPDPLPSRVPTVTAVPDSSGPIVSEPILVTRHESNVRTGPGQEYELYFTLPAGTQALILGRNEDSSWWAIAGPGDGPGPGGWLSAGDVVVQGNVSGVPLLSAPPRQVGNLDAPPAGVCIVSHPGLTGPINIHLGPGEQFALLAQLPHGRWLEAVQLQVGWYEVRLGPGETGWLAAAAVATGDLCPLPEAVPSPPGAGNATPTAAPPPSG
jgi:uncharacterized protein YgiM (DUF1202 family)